jgi:hypothetical protein
MGEPARIDQAARLPELEEAFANGRLVGESATGSPWAPLREVGVPASVLLGPASEPAGRLHAHPSAVVPERHHDGVGDGRRGPVAGPTHPISDDDT